MACHPLIRNAEACWKSSSLAVRLAKKHGTRLHVLHLTTKNELPLFSNELPLERKRITAEVCVHHLFFNSEDYADLGTRIKCNPAIKDATHQRALWNALLDDRLDVLATDHAPHTLEEKNQTYFKAPSGLPLVQHSLPLMLHFYHQGRITLERIVEKMCHNPAICFRIEDRGFLDEGAFADVILVDVEKEWEVTPENILYKCGWSPFEGMQFRGRVEATVVSGHLAYRNGKLDESCMGQRLTFQPLNG